MKKVEYPHKRKLLLAATLSVAGQVSAIAFMLRATPYSTFVFMTFGAGMIALGIAIFGYVVFKDVKARARSVTERRFGKGEFVFHEGDAGDRIYVVKSGEVEVVRERAEQGEILIARVGKGEYFGEMALLTDAPRSASVRAATDVTTLAIERDDFYALFSGIPAFQKSITAVMEERTRTKR